MIVGLALTPALDVTCEVDRLAIGGITRPSRVTRVAGGKTLNALRVAHALGGSVHAVAALGGHSGRWVRDLLRAERVPCTIVELSSATRTCTAIVESGSAVTSTDVYEPAPAFDVEDWNRFEAAVALLPADDATIVLSGSLPPGKHALETVPALLRSSRARGGRIVIDGSGAGLGATAHLADLVKVNRAEAGELLERSFPDAESACSALSNELGCDVIVTDGVRGAVAIWNGRTMGVPAPTRAGRFPAGSGDAFLGGLLSGIERGDDIEAALRTARDAAERNSRVPGQGILAGA